MRTLTVVENVSLDGVAQSPAGADEDPRGGFEAGGWAAAHLARDPEAAQRAMSDGAAAALLFGRRTYDQLVGFWLGATQANPFTEVLRSTPKYVASRRVDVELPHSNSFALVGEAAETVAALKADGDGSLVVLGSLRLTHDLIAAHLVDRFVLTTIPVVLGSGTRLFDEVPIAFDVEDSWVSARGTAVARYRVRG